MEAIYRNKFLLLTQSTETADRLIALITAYEKRSTWAWEDIAESTLLDLARGKSAEQIIKWFANLI